MITEPTVLVLGAGASMPYHFPSGLGLTQELISALDGERVDENPGLARAHQLLAEADQIIFLGFGYDQTNIERLLQYGPRVHQSFYGSALGLTPGEVRLAVNALGRAGCKNINDPDTDHGEVHAFLRYHSWLG